MCVGNGKAGGKLRWHWMEGDAIGGSAGLVGLANKQDWSPIMGRAHRCQGENYWVRGMKSEGGLRRGRFKAYRGYVGKMGTAGYKREPG